MQVGKVHFAALCCIVILQCTAHKPKNELSFVTFKTPDDGKVHEHYYLKKQSTGEAVPLQA
jgi:hypothetical protein